MIKDTRINTTTQYDQGYPSVATLSDGGFVVCWITLKGTDGNDNASLYAQRYDANGVKQGNEFLVYAANGLHSPEIASLNDGGFVVGWCTANFMEQDVYAQRYDANGIAQGSGFRVNADMDNQHTHLEMATLNDGGFIVSWTLYVGGSPRGVYAQRYDANGVAQGSEFRVNTYQSIQLEPAIAALNDGGFVVSWSSHDQDGSFGGIYAQRYDANGVMQGSEFRVNTYTNKSQVTPEIAVLSDGGFVVVWISYGQVDGVSSEIYAQRYDANGVAQGSEFRVNTYTADTQDSVEIAALDDGGFVVCWLSVNQDGGSNLPNKSGSSDIPLSGGGNGIYAQRYDANGVAQGTEFRVNTHTDGLQIAPAMTALNDGGFLINWTSQNQDGNGDGIFAHRYNAEGDAIGWTSVAADRLFNWAESMFTDLLPNAATSQEMGDYHVRLYENNNALGEKDGDIYFYDGHSIVLVGAVGNFLPAAIAAGF